MTTSVQSQLDQTYSEPHWTKEALPKGHIQWRPVDFLGYLSELIDPRGRENGSSGSRSSSESSLDGSSDYSIPKKKSANSVPGDAPIGFPIVVQKKVLCAKMERISHEKAARFENRKGKLPIDLESENE